jgi:hypothetical protein
MPTSTTVMTPAKPNMVPNPNSYSTHSQAQFQQPTLTPNIFGQQPIGAWQYANPYATMPRSHAKQYQQPTGHLTPSSSEQSSNEHKQRLRRSSTADDLNSNALSRSASSDQLSRAGAEKIRVRVINNNTPSSTDPASHASSRSQRSILKSNTESDGNQEMNSSRRIYTTSNEDVGTETMEDLFEIVNQQRQDLSQSASPMPERIIIIDRRGSNQSDNQQNITGKNRFRTFEIRASADPVTPTTPISPLPVTPTINTTASRYAIPPSNYFHSPQLQYQQPKMYGSVPNHIYASPTSYAAGVGGFYPFAYYHY